MQVSSKSNTSHLLTCFPVFVIISFGNPTYKKSLSIVKYFYVSPKLFCLLPDNVYNNLVYKSDLSRKTVTIRYVSKTMLVFVLDGRSLLFKESERKWRVGKKEKEKRKGNNEGEDRGGRKRKTPPRRPLSLFYARFPHFRLIPPPSHHMTRLI